MDKTITILGFAGSLRKGSYNRAMLRNAIELVPEGSRLETFELEGIPPFNDDLLSSMPEIVKDFKAKIRAADALLIVTPEYNRSIPGVLKNAIDWASRPPADNPFAGKPAAIISVSTGMLGGSMAQFHLRQVFVFLDIHPINRPEVYVSSAAQKFDVNLKFTDEKGKELIRDLLKALVAWTRKIQK